MGGDTQSTRTLVLVYFGSDRICISRAKGQREIKGMTMRNSKSIIVLHSVEFEPTSTNTLELESSPLDRSGKNA
jgi:hypothetical protein